MEGRRDGGTEGRRDGGTEGRRDGGTEGRRDGGTEGRRDGGTEEERVRELGSEGARERRGSDGGREGVIYSHSPTMYAHQALIIDDKSLLDKRQD